MTFDPGPADAFDFAPDVPPSPKKKQRRRRTQLSASAMRAIRRKNKALEQQLARDQELERRIALRMAERQAEQ